MTVEQLKQFRLDVDNCPASFNLSTVYSDGGRDYIHGQSECSENCTCSGYHYVSSDGLIYPNIQCTIEKKSMLKSGMVVRYRNGNLAVFMAETEDKHAQFISRSGIMILGDYNNDLTCKEGKYLDIIEIYDLDNSPHNFVTSMVDNKAYGKLIWNPLMSL